MLDPLRDLLHGELELGDHDRVGPAGQPGEHGDPSRVAAHHLDDHHAVVRLGRRVEAVDCVRGDLHRGVKAERVVRADHVVVDRLRHADDRQVDLLHDLPVDHHRVLAADRDQAVDLVLLDGAADAFEAALLPDRVEVRRGQDRAAEREDPRERLVLEGEIVALGQAAPSPADAHRDVAIGHELAAGGPDDGVDAGAVAARCEDPDPHRGSLGRPRPADASVERHGLGLRQTTERRSGGHDLESPHVRRRGRPVPRARRRRHGARDRQLFPGGERTRGRRDHGCQGHPLRGRDGLARRGRGRAGVGRDLRSRSCLGRGR